MNCTHPVVIENICISCGYSTEIPLVSVYCPVAIAPPRLNFKYSISNMDFYLTTTIQQILAPIHKLEYTTEIKKFIEEKSFGRISIIDKIAATTFYVLKRDDYPILLNDFSKISKRGIKNLLKNVCREFPYVYNTDKYIKAVITRIYNHLKIFGYDFDQVDLFNKMMVFYETQERCLVVANVALFSLFENDYEDCFYRYDLAEMTTLKGLHKISLKTKLPVKSMNKRNSGFVRKIEKAYNRLYRNKNEQREDEMDVYIEKLFLMGYKKEELLEKSVKEIKKMMDENLE